MITNTLVRANAWLCKKTERNKSDGTVSIVKGDNSSKGCQAHHVRVLTPSIKGLPLVKKGGDLFQRGFALSMR